MSDDIYIDVNYLTESERDIILQVLAKDEELRKQEKRRISNLKNELDEIKEKGASDEEIDSSRICARCRSPLGFVINSGALCPKCEARVCKECRKVKNSSWLCVLCAKMREVRAESGAWFFEQEKRKGERPQLYGTALVRASFRRAKPSSLHKKEVNDAEPGSPPVITQMSLHDHGGKLHRPIPVHMSRLAENEGEEGEFEKEDAEINQNYTQYTKANRITQKVEEEHSDEQYRGSSSSHSSTPRGSPVYDLAGGNDAVEEDTVFDHLVIEDDNNVGVKEEIDEQVNEHNVPQWANHTHGDDDGVNGYNEEEGQYFEDKVNNWDIEREQSRSHSEQVNSESSVEVKTSWHEIAHEWGQTGSSAQDVYPPKHLLDVRAASPDSSVTTGEFFTPLATPVHSGTGTPALSEHGQSEDGMGSGSDIFVDAGEATPVEGDRTPVAELSEQDDEENIGDVTVYNPEITCNTTPDADGAEPEEGHRTPTRDDDADSIEQAFASYERDHPNADTKPLQEQLNILSMGSRESIVSYYSEAGQGRFGKIPVTGEILFGLKYDKHKDQLQVQIHRAKDIAPADEKKGKSDPYVKVYLLPDKTKGGKRKTKTKKNTLEPDFDEILRFKIGFDEMLSRTLWLTMWNHDTFGHNDFLGEVMLPLDTYQESGFSWDDPSPYWYPLRERRSEPSLMTYCGDLTVSLMFEPGNESDKDKKKKKKKGGRLRVQLKEARNLPAKDSNGFSDPFVKRTLPKLFEKKASETEEAKLEAGETTEKPQETPEQEPLVLASQSHENLAFEDEEKHLQPKDTSLDSTTSTMDTTLESTASEGSQEVKNAEESGNDSGISESHVNEKDPMKVEDTAGDGHDEHEQDTEPKRDMKPVLKSISAFAMQFTVISPPEITVDKPKTLFTVAKGDNTDAPPQSPRRHTEHNIGKDLLKRNALSPEAAAITKRRHSDFAVSAPISINEELAREDLKKRGSNQVRDQDNTVRKGSIPEIVSQSRGPQWSPRLERKRQEDARKGKKKEGKTKTLAQLAMEAGYTTNVNETPDNDTETLQVTKGEPSKGSHESLFSDPGEEHYSSIPVTGEVYVSLRYEMRSNKFEVQVHSANNIASADPKKGSSDPYIKTYLLPDKRSKRKTKTKKDTLNPKFDEMLEYFIGYDELLTRTLQMSVWHKTLGRNYFLGEVKIPMNDFIEAHGNSLQQTIAKWFTLTEKSDETDGLPSIPCELVLALKYVTADKVKQKKGRQKGELHVHLLEARNLPGMDADGMSDPYCKCYLLPERKGKWKQKTPVVRRTLNPTFNHKFSYEEVSSDDLKERVLEISIYDFDRASPDEFIGGVRLGLGTSDNEWDDATEDECQIWQTMLSRSNVWIQVVVPLRSTMVSKKSV